jgi:aerobic-type carbon monoxide dehydrogenase small subunit (CoxS/CutS family)
VFVLRPGLTRPAGSSWLQPTVLCGHSRCAARHDTISRMSVSLALTVNGLDYDLEVPPAETLLYSLRYRLGLLGTKENCLQGECGVCTVLLDGRPVYACLLLTVLADGRSVTTVEGLGGANELDPLQQAFVETGAIQCGYCTPGMLLTARALLDETPQPTEQQIRLALSGNLCRCTGYGRIIEAVRLAAEQVG